MGRDTRRLVNHDDVIVVVDDAEVGHRHRDHTRFLAFFPVDLEPGSARQAVRFSDHATIHTDATGFGNLCREGAREPEHLGQGRVDPGALQTVGHGKTPRRHC